MLCRPLLHLEPQLAIVQKQIDETESELKVATEAGDIEGVTALRKLLILSHQQKLELYRIAAGTRSEPDARCRMHGAGAGDASFLFVTI
jgi:hypothetical protein